MILLPRQAVPYLLHSQGSCRMLSYRRSRCLTDCSRVTNKHAVTRHKRQTDSWTDRRYVVACEGLPALAGCPRPITQGHTATWRMTTDSLMDRQTGGIAGGDCSAPAAHQLAAALQILCCSTPLGPNLYIAWI